MRMKVNAATRDESTTKCNKCFRDATCRAREDTPMSESEPLCATHAAQSNAEMEVLR